MTPATTYKFLDFVNFSGLYNWSVQYLNDSKIRFNEKYPLVRIRDFLTRNRTAITIQDEPIYQRVTIRMRNGGVVLRNEIKGINIGTKKQYMISAGQFILSKIDARNGAMGIVPENLEGAVVTQDFLAYDIDKSQINPQYLVLVTTTKQFLDYCQNCSSGTTNRQRVDEAKFLNISIPLPPLDEQNKLVKQYNDLKFFVEMERMKILDLDVKSSNAVIEALGLQPYPGLRKKKLLQFSQFKDLYVWSAEQILYANISPYGQSKYDCKRLSQLALINPKTDLSTLHDDDELSFIPMEDISNIYGEWHEKKVGTKSQTKGYTKFQNGDIIWARITPCMQNGKSALVDNLVNGKGYGSTEFHVVRLKSNEVIPQYIHTLLRHRWVLYDARKYFTGSAGQQRVPASYLSNLLIPVPPLNVQQKIVDNYNEAIQIIKQGYAKIKEYTCDIKTNFEPQIFK